MNSYNTPRVSVVVIAYNVAPYIGHALCSALGQSLREIEVIAVDDGSTDGTLEILRGFHDPRLRVVESSHCGPVAALNRGIGLARGDLLAFLDGDDVWHTEKLAEHVRVLSQHPETDLTFSWYQIIDESGAETGLHSTRFRGTLSFPQLMADNVIGNGSSVVLRRKAFLEVGLFDERYAACWDLEAWLRLSARKPGGLLCIPAFLTYYRRRCGQMTRNTPLMESAWDKVLDEMRQMAPEVTSRVRAVACSNMCRFFAYSEYENGNYGRAASYSLRSLREAPRSFVGDGRNWKLAAAIAAAAVLPADLGRRLVRKVLRMGRARGRKS